MAGVAAVAAFSACVPRSPGARASAAHSCRDLDQPVQPGPRETPTLDAREADADLELLGYALERGYVAKRFVAPARWTAMTQRLAQLRGRATTVTALCDGIADALWEMPDGHLGARERKPGSKQSTKCGAEATKAFRPPSVGPNFAASEAGVWTATAATVGGASVGRLSIRAFSLHDDASWNGFDAAVADLLKKDAFLIDMRGNGGGDDTRGIELSNQLVDGQTSVGVRGSYDRQTPESLTLQMNIIGTYLAPSDAEKKLLADIASKRAVAAAGQLPEWHEERETPQPTRVGPHAYRGRVAILVDAACASACESALEYLRQYPRARVFGEATHGDLYFGDIGMLALPNSRIRVILPTGYMELARAFRDREGFPPDVITPSGQDALKAAEAWLVAPAE